MGSKNSALGGNDTPDYGSTGGNNSSENKSGETAALLPGGGNLFQDPSLRMRAFAILGALVAANIFVWVLLFSLGSG